VASGGLRGLHHHRLRARVPARHPLSRGFGVFALANVCVALAARVLLVDLLSCTGLDPSEWSVFVMVLKVSLFLYSVSMNPEWSASEALRCEHLLWLGFAAVLLNASWIGVAGSHAVSHCTTLHDFAGFAAFGMLVQGVLVAFLVA
jgi:hypothetical protein